MSPEISYPVQNGGLSTVHAGKTSFLFDFEKGEFDLDNGKPRHLREEEALTKWAEKILRTQADRFPVYYDTDYGCRIEDLIVGQRYRADFVEAELRREIEEALIKHEQIRGISAFEAKYNGGERLTIKVDIDTTYNTTIKGVTV